MPVHFKKEGARQKPKTASWWEAFNGRGGEVTRKCMHAVWSPDRMGSERPYYLLAECVCRHWSIADDPVSSDNDDTPPNEKNV